MVEKSVCVCKICSCSSRTTCEVGTVNVEFTKRENSLETLEKSQILVGFRYIHILRMREHLNFVSAVESI